MIEYRFCPECGQPLDGRDLGEEEGFHPWCPDCGKLYVQPCPLELAAVLINRKGEILLAEEYGQPPALPRSPVGYGEWLEDAVHRACEQLVGSPPIVCEYLNSFWDEDSETLVAGMKVQCMESDVPHEGSYAPSGYVWRPMSEGRQLPAMERALLKLC